MALKFIITMENRCAKQILSRIYAIRMAEKINPYVYAATLVESVNWANQSLLKDDTSGRHYSVIHRFWVQLSGKCAARNMRNLIKYDSDSLRYECLPAESVLHKVWRQMR